MITAVRSGKCVTRNASLFKRVNLGPCQREEEDSDDGNDDDNAELNDDKTENHLNRSQINNRNGESHAKS